MKTYAILFVLLRLLLGGLLIYGGVQKFARPIPEPVEVAERAAQFKEPGQEGTLQKILYISGAKQTGYFWQVLGICELLFGLLLVIQYTGFVGAVFALPITLHIFLFHLFLEADEMGELAKTAGMLFINILIVLREYPGWKRLLWVRPL